MGAENAVGTARGPAKAGRLHGAAQLWGPARFPAPGRGSRARRAIVAGAKPWRRVRVVPGGAASNAVVAPGRDVELGERAEKFGVDGDDAFDWARQWYPVASLRALEEAGGEGHRRGLPQVQRQTVLGRDVVVWRDAQGAWRAAEDRCAHMQAALSLGTVRPDGTLACQFHGWCFNGHGECTHAPQTTEAASRSGSSSKIAAFPTLEKHGLLWVWPDDSPSSWIDSAARAPAAHGVTGADTEWTVLDLPISYVAAVNKTLSSTDSNCAEDSQGKLLCGPWSYDSQPVANFVQKGDTSASRGFSLSDEPLQGGLANGRTEIEFRPPCLVTTGVSNGDSVLNSALYHTPVSQGRTRLVYGRSVESGVGPGRFESEDGLAALRAVVRAVEAVPNFVRALPLLLLPRYVRASMEHLRAQEEIEEGVPAPGAVEMRGSRDNINWRRYPIVPPPSGLGVAAFHSWLNRFAGGEPALFSKGNSQGAAQMATHPRWESHTKSCPACRKTLNFLRGLEAWLPRAGVLLLALTLFAGKVRSSDFRLVMPLWGAAAVAFWAFAKAQDLRCKLLRDNVGAGFVEDKGRRVRF
ncbi:unnamed protein product [Ostreobium quekettii]|uniref:Rieske domain-containing protein n=1 Tax=Ostreobium quekettii TaxID=121088 RepID=A0A8S1IX84_9CHLO|nr:unnamed protein product [Ostreobium quekettii]